MASPFINDKTKVRTKILLSPVQDLNRLLYCEWLKGIKGILWSFFIFDENICHYLDRSDFDEYLFHKYFTKIIYEIASLRV